MTTDEFDPFAAWHDALQRRHFRQLTFPEVRRAVQALSGMYVKRAGALRRGAALDGAGKRAAFALFYGPLHFLVVRRIVQDVGLAVPAPDTILDLGCGSGAAGAAWALEAARTPRLLGIDRSPWAASEARWSWSALGLNGRTRVADLASIRLGRAGDAVVSAFTVNEIPDEDRERLMPRLLRAAEAGVAVLVVEPVARRSAPWWGRWENEFRAHGGDGREWRFRTELPEELRRLDRAAGLDHRELTARGLWLRP